MIGLSWWRAPTHPTGRLVDETSRSISTSSKQVPEFVLFGTHVATVLGAWWQELQPGGVGTTARAGARQERKPAASRTEAGRTHGIRPWGWRSSRSRAAVAQPVVIR
jgi:hypothetical protein